MFTDKQREALAAPLNLSAVKGRKQGNITLSYLEGWHVIAEANRIFGYDCWARETIETRMVNEAARKVGNKGDPGWSVSYIAKVRITVFAGDTIVTREGIGAGHGIDRDLGLAHESAIKESETDAMKRALTTFGSQFGLALYDKSRSNVVDDRSREDNERTIDQWGERRGSELARAAAPPNGHRTNDVIWDETEVRPSTPDDDPLAETLRAAYLHSARERIRKATNADELRTWWGSDESKRAREDFELTAAESKDLIEFCKARIDQLKGVK